MLWPSKVRFGTSLVNLKTYLYLCILKFSTSQASYHLSAYGRAKQTFLIRILCKTRLVYTPKLPTQYGWSWFGAGRKVTFKFWLSYCNIVRIARKDFDLVVEGDLQTKRNITAGHCFGHNEISGQKHVFIIIYEFKKSIWRDDQNKDLTYGHSQSTRPRPG